MAGAATHITFRVRDYNLAATLTSGQTFRWRREHGGWTGVVRGRWLKLTRTPQGLHAQTGAPVRDWTWLRTYLQVDVNLEAVLATFPADAPLRAALQAAQGLRLLRQDPWECLVSFILSSNKQIAQIRQIIEALCSAYGQPLPVPPGYRPAFDFPSPARLTRASEADLRACKMGYRAAYLLATAQRIAANDFDLERLHGLPEDRARAELMQLPGVGRKVADCVLLFAYGYGSVFPMDVWVTRALRQLYFGGRRVGLRSLRAFAARHFGPHAGLAQQYLFHYMRTCPSKRVGERACVNGLVTRAQAA